MTRVHDHHPHHPLRPAADPQHNHREKAKADDVLHRAKHMSGAKPSYLRLAEDIAALLTNSESLNSEFGGLLANTQNMLARAASEDDTLGYNAHEMKTMLRRLNQALSSGRLPQDMQRVLRQARRKLESHRGTRQPDWHRDTRPDQTEDRPWTIQPHPGPDDILNNWRRNHAADLRLDHANRAAQLAPWAADPMMLSAANQFESIANAYNHGPYGNLVNRVQDMLARASVYGDGLGYERRDVMDLMYDVNQSLRGRPGPRPGRPGRPMPRSRHNMPYGLRQALMSIMPLLRLMTQHSGEPGFDQPQNMSPHLDYSDGF